MAAGSMLGYGYYYLFPSVADVFGLELDQLHRLASGFTTVPDSNTNDNQDDDDDDATTQNQRQKSTKDETNESYPNCECRNHYHVHNYQEEDPKQQQSSFGSAPPLQQHEKRKCTRCGFSFTVGFVVQSQTLLQQVIQIRQQSQPNDATTVTHDTIETKNDNPILLPPTILFKYGTTIFYIPVVGQSNHHHQTDASNSTLNIGSDHSDTLHAIANLLGLEVDTMKILHKGKVLNKTTNAPKQQEQKQQQRGPNPTTMTVNDQIISLSSIPNKILKTATNTKSTSTSTSSSTIMTMMISFLSKPQLLVMGTPSSLHLPHHPPAARPKQTSDGGGNNNDNHHTNNNLWMWVILPVTIVIIGFYLSSRQQQSKKE